MAGHARLSPSGSDRWTGCTASADEESGLPNLSNEASRGGTAQHLVAGECLASGEDAVQYSERVVGFVDIDGRETEMFLDELEDPFLEVLHEVEIDDDSVEECQQYIDYVRNRLFFEGGELHVEVRLSIEHVTGEVGAGGTSDAVIVNRPMRKITVIDAKFGRIQVNAFRRLLQECGIVQTEPNRQLALYGDAALEHFGRADFDTVDIAIVQPKLRHISEFSLSATDLTAFVKRVHGGAAERIRNGDVVYAPEIGHCYYCTALATCKAVRDEMLALAVEGYESPSDLAQEPKLKVVDDSGIGLIYESLDLLDAWAEAVRGRVVDLLTRGRPVFGRKEPLKLIAGRPGRRAWRNAETMGKVLTDELGLGEDLAYKKKVASPTQIEALTKKRRVPKGAAPYVPPIDGDTWTRLAAYIADRKPGSPKVVPASHHLPAIESLTDGFSDQSE